MPDNLPDDWGRFPGDASFGHEDTQRESEDEDEPEDSDDEADDLDPFLDPEKENDDDEE